NPSLRARTARVRDREDLGDSRRTHHRHRKRTRGSSFLRYGRYTPSRHWHDPRPGGNRHPHRPPLCTTHYAALRDSGDRARVFCFLQHESRGRRAGQGHWAGERGVWIMADLRDLYQEVILEHSKAPRNYRQLAAANHHAEGFNPLCGDHFTVYLEVEGEAIRDVSFQ